MNKKIVKKQDEEKNGFNPVAAAVAGAVIGAGIAVAGTIALKDEKNRKKVKEVMNNIKDQAVGYAEGKKDELEEKVKNKGELHK